MSCYSQSSWSVCVCVCASDICTHWWTHDFHVYTFDALPMMYLTRLLKKQCISNLVLLFEKLRLHCPRSWFTLFTRTSLLPILYKRMTVHPMWSQTESCIDSRLPRDTRHKIIAFLHKLLSHSVFSLSAQTRIWCRHSRLSTLRDVRRCAQRYLQSQNKKYTTRRRRWLPVSGKHSCYISRSKWTHTKRLGLQRKFDTLSHTLEP